MEMTAGIGKKGKHQSLQRLKCRAWQLADQQTKNAQIYIICWKQRRGDKDGSEIYSLKGGDDVNRKR